MKTELPQLRHGERQGDVFANQSEAFALIQDRGTDFDRIEKTKAEKAQAMKQAEKLQRELI